MISLKAQKILHGTIIIDEYNGGQENVEILNITHNTKVISNDYSFDIEASISDELLFESAMTIPRKFKVSKSVYDKGTFVIHLDRYVVNLKEINASKVLTGDLEKDLATVKKEEKFEIDVKLTASDIAKFEVEEPPALIKPMTGELPSQVDLIAVGGLIASLFKKKGGRLPPKKNVEPKKSLEEIRTYFGDDFFTEELGIPIAEIPAFMAFTLQKHEKLLNENYLDIIAHFNNEVENYIKRDKTVLTE